MTCEREVIDAPRSDASVDTVDAAPLPSFGELSGHQWLMPCTAAPSPTLCDCTDASAKVTVGGTIGVTYTVKVRIRGIMERGTYSGGSSQGAWYIGGQTTSTFLTVAELRVSAPAQHYYLNNVPSQQGLPTLDYEATLSIAGGAELELFMSALDNREIANTTKEIAGVVTTPSPYLGQFAQIDVLEVTAP